MRSTYNYMLAIVLGSVVWAAPVDAETQRVLINIYGKYCNFYIVDVERALKRIPGVRSVDSTAVQGHVVVQVVPGKVSPSDMLAAIRSVKGADHSCQGKFAGEPGLIEK